MTRIARAGALLALALLTALALAGPATAKKKPSKHGAQSAKVLPKSWSKQHKVKGAKADPDDDGLSNWGEYRSHTKPKRADTDKDGIGDADEDRDRDGLDNGSELDAGTDPGRKDSDRDGTRDGAEDADEDGLTNAAEDQTGNHPRKRDSDGDGIVDGDENAGAVAAFDGTNLTIALAVGGTLTAALGDGAAIGCDDDLLGGDEDAADLVTDDPGDVEDEESGDWGEDDGQAFSVTAQLAEEGEEDAADDEEWFEDDDCSAEIAPGAAVREAEVEGGAFVALELVL